MTVSSSHGSSSNSLVSSTNLRRKAQRSATSGSLNSKNEYATASSPSMNKPRASSSWSVISFGRAMCVVAFVMAGGGGAFLLSGGSSSANAGRVNQGHEAAERLQMKSEVKEEQRRITSLAKPTVIKQPAHKEVIPPKKAAAETTEFLRGVKSPANLQSSHNKNEAKPEKTEALLHIFQPLPTKPELQHSLASLSSLPIHHQVSSLQQQEAFVKQYGTQCLPLSSNDNLVHARFLELNEYPSLQTELWKYCALFIHGGIFLDGEGVLLQTLTDAFHISKNQCSLQWSAAPLSLVYPGTLHGSLLALKSKHHAVAKTMLQLILETSNQGLVKDALFLPSKLYQAVSDYIHQETPLTPGTYTPNSTNEPWKLWEMACHFDPLPATFTFEHNSPHGMEEDKTHPWGGQEELKQEDAGRGNPLISIPRYHRMYQHCPKPNDYCCTIASGGVVSSPLFLTQHPIFPHRTIPPVESLPLPYKFTVEKGELDARTKAELPFISTISGKMHPTKPQNYPPTPNFFDMLHSNDCLPSDKACSTCLRNKKGADCQKCKEECPCFCGSFCQVRPRPKYVKQTITVRPPVYAKEVDRIVPRIVHQTWFEPVTREKYPNMSRLIQSWKQSGWEYRFYDDAAIEAFLKMHFPPEVFQAYDWLIPGAFKADLFRYCVLLIYGGVYADMDVLLESHLEAAVPPDVGFMTPVDEPGSPVDHRMCLWNGLIATAPAHPFLAKVIEIVVNNIRNRFTSVDVDNMLCPVDGKKKEVPELSVSHAFDTLFTAGPCVLGMAINTVLGRDLQKSFRDGLLEPSGGSKKVAIPGRSIILRQDKQDMGAHRFTLVESNLVVAATDMPDYDDRQNLNKVKKEEAEKEGEEDGATSEKKKEGGAAEHYSKVHVKVGVYGLNGLYKEGKSADEDIKLIVEGGGGYVHYQREVA